MQQSNDRYKKRQFLEELQAKTDPHDPLLHRYL